MPVPRWVEIVEGDPTHPVCGVLYAAEGSDASALAAVAREFSPRIEVCGPREITLDLSGLSRLFGDAKAIAAELRRTAADRGLRVRVAIAGTSTAARLLVRHRAGITVVGRGTEASALAAVRTGEPARARARGCCGGRRARLASLSTPCGKTGI